MNRKTKLIMVLCPVTGFVGAFVSQLMSELNVLMCLGLAVVICGGLGGIVSVFFRIFEKQPNKPKAEQKQ